MASRTRFGRFAAVAGLLLAAAPGWAAWKLADLKPVTGAGEAVAPVISPDGRRVAYIVGKRFPMPDGFDVLSGRLWVMDRATGKPSRIGKVAVEALQGEEPAAFSPGNAGYAYVEGRRAEPNLWYVDPHEGRYRVASGRAMSFSPDGRYLAYIRWQPGESGRTGVELWLFDTHSHESKRLARVEVSDAPRRALTPVWVSEASRIIFSAGGSVYAYARYTGELADLLNVSDVWGYDAHSSGVLWYRRRSGHGDTDGIWSADLSGNHAIRMFPADSLPAEISDLRAGPDASTVLFIGATDAGQSLILADAKDGRWRALTRAAAFSCRGNGPLLALEVADRKGPDTRNIYTARVTGP